MDAEPVARRVRPDGDGVAFCLELPERIGQLQEQSRGLERELGQLKAKLASSRGIDLAEQSIAECPRAALIRRD